MSVNFDRFEDDNVMLTIMMSHDMIYSSKGDGNHNQNRFISLAHFYG